jgi:hypothetical protein
LSVHNDKKNTCVLHVKLVVTQQIEISEQE